MSGLRLFLVVMLAALLLGRLGPFGTFAELAAVPRYAYWLGLTLLLWLQIEAARLLLHPLPWLARRHWTLAAAAAALAGGAPSAFEVAWAESLLRVERDLGLLDLVMIYGDVMLIALPLSLVLELLRRRSPVPGGAAYSAGAGAGAGAASAEQLLAMLPPERRGRLIALAAEDHYLRVYTEAGEALILRRFADALADASGLDGLRVHRSWWVSRGAVVGVERAGERIVLRLTNDVRAPVSRSYAMSVREAGLIPG